MKRTTSPILGCQNSLPQNKNKPLCPIWQYMNTIPQNQDCLFFGTYGNTSPILFNSPAGNVEPTWWLMCPARGLLLSSPLRKGTFFHYPRVSLCGVQRIHLDLHWQNHWNKSAWTHATGPGPGKGLGHPSLCCCWTHPFPDPNKREQLKSFHVKTQLLFDLCIHDSVSW